MKGKERFNLVAAINEGIAYSRAGDDFKKYLREMANRRLYPWFTAEGIEYWDQIKTHDIARLIRQWENEKLSPQYIRHLLKPLQAASNALVDLYGLPRQFEISRRMLPPPEQKPIRWLTFEQVANCCRTARNPALRPAKKHGLPRPLEAGRIVVLVCGLTGIRITEFLRLTPADLTADNVLTIGNAGAKTENAFRSIPVPEIVGNELREHWRRRVGHTKDLSNIRHRVQGIFHWTAGLYEGHEILRETPPKNLRKTLINELIDDVPRHFIQAYCGWGFAGIDLQRYANLRPRPDDMPEMRQRAINRLRERITAEVERRIEGLNFG